MPLGVASTLTFTPADGLRYLDPTIAISELAAVSLLHEEEVLSTRLVDLGWSSNRTAVPDRDIQLTGSICPCSS